jgi:YfiH family protein
VADADWAPDFAALGLLAFTTARAGGSFGLGAGDAPVGDVVGRWDALSAALSAAGAPQLASVRQVHGARLVEVHPGWVGWLRGGAADGLLARHGGVALAVTVADCVPVFLAHPAGAIALLHAGWRGTAAGILPRAVGRLADAGYPPDELRCHLGPAIGGAVYQVGPEVHEAVGAARPAGPASLDLREVLARQAGTVGVRHLTRSEACTVRDQPRWFSHRAGDTGRQLGVLVAPSP